MNTTPTKENYTYLDFTNRHCAYTGRIIKVYGRSDGIITRFSDELTDEIQAKGMTHMRVRLDNITGELHLVFNKKGIGIPVKKNGKENTCTIRNKDLGQYLIERFGAYEMAEIEASEDLANTEEYITYHITKA